MDEKFNSIEELLDTEKAQEMMDENLSSYNDESYVYAVLEYAYWSHEDWKIVYTFDDLENAINDIEDQKYQIYHCMDCYYDSVDETIEFPKGYEYLERYFDYDAFHNDCGYDVTETSNWVVIWNW